MMDEVYHFGVLFKQISLAFETAMQREAERYDLTPAQANILIYLSEVDHPVNQRELEYYYRLSNPTVTGLMQRMEAKGFIKRETNQGDGRSKYILLTPKAEKIVHEVEMAIDKLEKKVVQDLTEEEQVRLRNLLLRTLTILYDCKGHCQCKEEKMD